MTGGNSVNYRLALLCVFVPAALLALAGAVAAAPSFYGYTGLVAVPTADALDKDDYNVLAFTLNLEEGADSDIYGANLGLAEGLEVGFARFRPDEGDSETYLNAKYKFAPETEDRPALAAGLFDLTDELDTTVYVVMSKSLMARSRTRFGDISTPRLHFGIGGGQFDGVFAGLSAVLADRLMLMVEHDSDQVNFGARLALTDEIRAHFAGLDGFDDIGLGLSFNKTF
jgi:hypothetical protein